MGKPAHGHYYHLELRCRVLAAFFAACLRAALPRWRAEVFACFDNALCDAAARGSRFKALLVARERTRNKRAGLALGHLPVNRLASYDVAVDTSHSDILEPSVGNCVIAIIKKIHFNESAKGFETYAHYPFNFNPHYVKQAAPPPSP